MSEFTNGDVTLYYEDHPGNGKTYVLVHGWPLSSKSWGKQVAELTAAGHRVVTYDRRGFGVSSKPESGYTYEAFTSDLAALIEHLDLRDVILAGFSMGGGEVARYCKQHGTDRLAGVALIGSVTPYLMKTDDNPDGGLTEDVLNEILESFNGGVKEAAEGFVENFYGADGHVVASESDMKQFVELASQAKTEAVVQSASAWGTTDFRPDLAHIDVPTVVVHGDADAAVPFEVSGERTAAAIKGAERVVISGGPHGIVHTHPDQVNQALISLADR